jgi:hypothetical protein
MICIEVGKVNEKLKRMNTSIKQSVVFELKMAITMANDDGKVHAFATYGPLPPSATLYEFVC